MAGGDSVIEEKLPRFNEPIDWSQIKIYYQLDGGDPFCTRTKQYIRDAIVRAANHFHDKFKSTVEQVTFAEFEEAFDLFMENFKDPTITPLASALVDGKGEISIMRELALSLIGKSNVTLPSIFVSLLEKMTPSSPSPEHVTKYKQLKSKFNSMLGDNSIFLYPVHPQVAPKHKTTLLRVNNAVGYCGLFNLLATPVTTCPLGLNDEGLPMSVQIVASPNMDHLTIEAASELDSVFGGWRPPSPVELAASWSTGFSLLFFFLLFCLLFTAQMPFSHCDHFGTTRLVLCHEVTHQPDTHPFNAHSNRMLMLIYLSVIFWLPDNNDRLIINKVDEKSCVDKTMKQSSPVWPLIKLKIESEREAVIWFSEN